LLASNPLERFVSSKVATLQALAALSAEPIADRESVTSMANLLHALLGVEHVCVVFPEDNYLAMCGDLAWDGEVPTGQRGLWLIGEEMRAAGGPIGFDVEEGKIVRVCPAGDSDGSRCLAFPIVEDGYGDEILIVQSGAGRHFSYHTVRELIEAAKPSIRLVLDHALAGARAAKQKEQMTALGNAAELLIQAENVEPVLEDLATTISESSGLDVVTIDVYDCSVQTFTLGVLNRVPETESVLARIWRRQVPSMTFPQAILEAAMTQPEPLVFADLQNDERIPEYGREFFRRAAIRSGGQFPIRFGDRFHGVLRAGSRRPRTIQGRDSEVLDEFASQIAVAMEALAMYKSLAESERQLKQYARELETRMQVQHRLARTDALTGVPNRRYVDEILEGECARMARHESSLSVSLIDVDFFKRVNDTYGHKTGDEVLIQLADLMRRSCRSSDAVGRYGGDEFLFILPKAGLKAATQFAERMRKLVEDHVFPLSRELEARITVSAGVAEYAGGSDNVAALVKRADEALYEAKERGRNMIAWSRSMREQAA
jgi:diguanylate cyclase (GGDEF)-like protein